MKEVDLMKYYELDQNGKISCVMEFFEEETIPAWVKTNCHLAEKPIVELFGGGYAFEDEVDWDAEAAKKAAAEYAALKDRFTAFVQQYMDEKAHEKNYDNILAAISYAAGTDEVFKAEGAVCLAWRDAVWRKCYSILDEVTAGSRPIPTQAELIEELPKLDWETLTVA